MNEIRLFPQFTDKPKLRQDAYQKLWKELYNYISLYASTSESHLRIHQHMEKLWPDLCKGIYIKLLSTNNY
jgi:hypothetical protein